MLWLWHRPAAAALIQSLAWQPPYAARAALKGKKKKVLFQIEENKLLTKSSPRKLMQQSIMKIFLLFFLPSFLPSFLSFFLFFIFLEPHPRHMKVPRLGVTSELWLPAYTTAMQVWPVTYTKTYWNTRSLIHWARPGIKPASQTCILMDASQFRFCWAMMGTSQNFSSCPHNVLY